MPLFEVAIVLQPTHKEKEEGVAERLVFGPRAVIARDEQGAAISAVLDGGVEAGIDRTRLEVMVRPFA